LENCVKALVLQTDTAILASNRRPHRRDTYVRLKRGI